MQTMILMHLQMIILRRMSLSLVIGLLYLRFQSLFSSIRAKITGLTSYRRKINVFVQSFAMGYTILLN